MAQPLPTPSTSLLARRPGAASLPAVVQRARPATACASPVLRGSRASPTQLCLPFFAPGSRGG